MVSEIFREFAVHYGAKWTKAMMAKTDEETAKMEALAYKSWCESLEFRKIKPEQAQHAIRQIRYYRPAGKDGDWPPTPTEFADICRERMPDDKTPVYQNPSEEADAELAEHAKAHNDLVLNCRQRGYHLQQKLMDDLLARRDRIISELGAKGITIDFINGLA